MKIYVYVGKNEEILDGLFDFSTRMVWSSLHAAIQGLEVDPKSDDVVIMEGELTDQRQIAECVCQCLIGNTHPKMTVKWIASYSKQLLAA